MEKLFVWYAIVLSYVAGIAQASNLYRNSLVVDLGYEIYEGYYNATSDLNVFKGLRYAAPPTGSLRWQKPRSPAVNRTITLNATAYPPRCPQSPDSPLATNFDFDESGLGDEDCLFATIFAPANASDLPVMVWIHGGGYGTGQGNNEFWELLQTNDNGFVLVLIQYRLGAFGWLSSDDLVNNGGVPNAGLHDMHFALQWVKQHIGQFGGDSDHVTISGESAGAGAVMLLGMTNNGSEGTSLFTNSIAASPYLPTQWRYDGLAPTQAYDNFATEVGCTDDSQNSSIFACLVGADTLTLQNASAIISGSYKYGQWAFLPVTDTNFLSERPSVQLNAGQVNGLRLLTSNNADEGQGFVPQNITSESDFNEYVEGLFPLMSRNNITRILEAYSIALVKPGPLFSTLGDSGPTALNQSEFAIGQQQRANNLYAETTFVCPSYWLANGYMASKWPGKTGTSQKRAAWKYQFSVPPSEHGADLDAYQAFNREALGEGTMTTAARLAIQLAWGRFIMYDNPTLPDSIILDLVTGTNGISTHDNITAISSSNWPQWSSEPPLGQSLMLNVNMTGGMPHVITWTPVGGTAINITQMTAPGLEAAFRIVDANSWEAGRAQRCEVWRELGDVVPE